MTVVQVGDIFIGRGHKPVIFAGPCVVESRDLAMATAEFIKKTAEKHGLPVVYKSSYKKANRSSLDSFSSLGDEKSLAILQEVKTQFGLPIITDIHSEKEAAFAAQVADILQIPAFLCRQTELLVAAGETGKVVNIKKGQFLAPTEMKYAAEKVESTGNKRVLLCERGTTFGYGNLVVDMRGLEIMRNAGYPVVMDCTHSVQLPGTAGGKSGGQPEFIFAIARAAAAVGVDAFFMEVHPEPSKALSDATTQLEMSKLDNLLLQIKTISETVRAIGAVE